MAGRDQGLEAHHRPTLNDGTSGTPELGKDRQYEQGKNGGEKPMELRSLRERLRLADQSLPRPGPVRWTNRAGSADDPWTDPVVIKPSGLSYEGTTLSDRVVVALDGREVAA